ncbi:MAG: murein biosynthesis integral membrane protein MurJ [Pseudonocardia sp.]
MSTSGERVVAKAAAISAILAGAGSALGLARDVLVGALFGANRQTDAFFVAWTLPETTAPLLIEGTMAFVMVPAFGRALAAAEARRAADVAAGGIVATADPTRELIEATFLRIVLGLAAVGVFVAVAAPWLISVLAPGLPDAELATRCLRAVAVTVPLFGIAGYLAAALRTHGQFAAPAAINLAYNLGIILTILLTYRWFGVLGAAIGISVGAVLMVAVQLPSTVRRVPLPRTLSLRRTTTLLVFAAFLPVAAHSLARQAQVLIERFAAAPPDWFGSGPLAEGTISHLNYSQKIAQIPITLSFMAAAVTFPIFAKSVASGDSDQARRRMEIDTAVLGGIALLVTAYLTIYAPAVVEVLFQRREFTAEDTAATAAILRIYVLGILGQALVSLLVRPFFTFQSRIWFPAFAMLWGLLVTAVATFLLVGPFGAGGIAGANALGITVTAVILAVGARSRLSTAPTPAAYGRMALLAIPVGLAALVGLGVHRLLAGAPAVVLAGVGGICMVAVTGGICLLALRLRAREGAR